MLKPSQQYVIDVYHDDSAMAHALVSTIQQLRLTKRIREHAIERWHAQLQPTHATLVVTEQPTLELLVALSCPQQLLVIPQTYEFPRHRHWQGDYLRWPARVPELMHRLQLTVSNFNMQRQLGAVRESLVWHTQRVEREYELIEHIFRNALSRNFLEYQHIRTLVAPAAKFNGDLCLVAPGPLGNLYVMLADFTGHGLAPATGALPLSQAFFFFFYLSFAIAEMVTEFNYRLHHLLPHEMFCACIVLELSANGERLSYWNGGMPPAIVYSTTGEIKHQLHAQHLALGVLSNDEFDQQVSTIKTASTDCIALYTDGVIEMLGQNREFFGLDALQALLQKYPNPTQFEQLVASLEKFRGTQPLQDDLSLAVLQCCPTGLALPEVQTELQSLPFRFATELHPVDLQRVDVVSTIVGLLSRLPALHGHRTTLYLLLAEVYNNALEHGLLGLDSRMKNDPEGFAYYYQLRAERLAALTSGSVTIALTYDHSRHYLTCCVRNSGASWQLPEQLGTVDQSQPYGRGLELLQQLAERLEWRDEGREIEFGYQLPPRL